MEAERNEEPPTTELTHNNSSETQKCAQGSLTEDEILEFAFGSRLDGDIAAVGKQNEGTATKPPNVEPMTLERTDTLSAAELAEASSNANSYDEVVGGESNSLANVSISRNYGSTSPPEEEKYLMKEVEFSGRLVKYLMQNANGPCPLIAIVNSLILQGRISLGPQWSVSPDHLVTLLANLVLEEKEKRLSHDNAAIIDHNVEAAMSTLTYIKRGLDMNPRFAGVDAFEFTKDIALFDILNVKLFHCWIPDDEKTLALIGSRGYNEISAIATTCADDDAICIAEFLASSVAQMTSVGIVKLGEKLNSLGDVAILFWNNHFHSIICHQDVLYLLVTDQGFLRYSNYVFSSLVSVDQSLTFYTDGSFQRILAQDDSPMRSEPSELSRKVEQEEQDLALARALDMEERQQYDQEVARARNRPQNTLNTQTTAMHHQTVDRQPKKSSCVVS